MFLKMYQKKIKITQYFKTQLFSTTMANGQ